MAVAFDAVTEAHTGTTGSASEASFTWNHGGAVSGVKGVLIFVWTNADASLIGSVTYGGVTVPAVSGGEAADTAGEPGRCSAFFLGEDVPQGTQAVVVNRTNNATVMSATSWTVTANNDTAVHLAGINLVATDGTVAEISVDDGTNFVNSLRFAGMHFGQQTPPTVGASSSNLQVLDIGATGMASARETTAGKGSRPVGMSSGTSDDRAIVTLAIKEVMAPTKAALSLVGQAASLAFAMGIGAASLGLAGQAPTLQVGNPNDKTISIPAGSLLFKGPARPLAVAAPAQGTLSLAGQTPNLALTNPCLLYTSPSPRDS